MVWTPFDLGRLEPATDYLQHIPAYGKLTTPGNSQKGAQLMSNRNLLLIIILVILIGGAAPTWPYSTGWGYYPSGGLGLLLVILIILLLLGRI